MGGAAVVHKEDPEFFLMREEYQDRYYRALYGDDLVDHFGEDYAIRSGTSPDDIELDLDGSYEYMSMDTVYSDPA